MNLAHTKNEIAKTHQEVTDRGTGTALTCIQPRIHTHSLSSMLTTSSVAFRWPGEHLCYPSLHCRFQTNTPTVHHPMLLVCEKHPWFSKLEICAGAGQAALHPEAVPAAAHQVGCGDQPAGQEGDDPVRPHDAHPEAVQRGAQEAHPQREPPPGHVHLSHNIA